MSARKRKQPSVNTATPTLSHDDRIAKLLKPAKLKPLDASTLVKINKVVKKIKTEAGPKPSKKKTTAAAAAAASTTAASTTSSKSGKTSKCSVKKEVMSDAAAADGSVGNGVSGSSSGRSGSGSTALSKQRGSLSSSEELGRLIRSVRARYKAKAALQKGKTKCTTDRGIFSLRVIPTLTEELFAKIIQEHPLCDWNYPKTPVRYHRPEMIFHNCAFILATTKVTVLKKLFEAIQQVIPNASILFKHDGITINEAADDDKILISINLYPHNLAGYHCPVNFNMRFNIKKISDCFSGIKKVKYFTILTVEHPDRMRVQFFDDKNNTHTSKDIYTLDAIYAANYATMVAARNATLAAAATSVNSTASLSATTDATTSEPTSAVAVAATLSGDGVTVKREEKVQPLCPDIERDGKDELIVKREPITTAGATGVIAAISGIAEQSMLTPLPALPPLPEPPVRPLKKIEMGIDIYYPFKIIIEISHLIAIKNRLSKKAINCKILSILTSREYVVFKMGAFKEFYKHPNIAPAVPCVVADGKDETSAGGVAVAHLSAATAVAAGDASTPTATTPATPATTAAETNDDTASTTTTAASEATTDAPATTAPVAPTTNVSTTDSINTDSTASVVTTSDTAAAASAATTPTDETTGVSTCSTLSSDINTGSIDGSSTPTTHDEPSTSPVISSALQTGVVVSTEEAVDIDAIIEAGVFDQIDLDVTFWKKILKIHNKIKLTKDSNIVLQYTQHHPFVQITQEISNLGEIISIVAKVDPVALAAATAATAELAAAATAAASTLSSSSSSSPGDSAATGSFSSATGVTNDSSSSGVSAESAGSSGVATGKTRKYKSNKGGIGGSKSKYKKKPKKPKRILSGFDPTMTFPALYPPYDPTMPATLTSLEQASAHSMLPAPAQLAFSPFSLPPLPQATMMTYFPSLPSLPPLPLAHELPSVKLESDINMPSTHP